VYDDIVALSEIPPHGRILEIGCGTGQATVPFARRGYRIQCVELGANMAAVARHNLAPYPAVDIWVGSFETWPVEPAAFDLAIAATAFHWVDPAIGYPRLADALRPRGSLAIFGSEHVKVDEDNGFFDALQEVYERETPEIADGKKNPHPDDIPDNSQQIAASGYFEIVASRRYLWSQTYTAPDYIRVLNTYSGHRRLAPEARERLFNAITGKIEQQPGAQVTKGYLTTLVVARRR
jgi:SAM-dependent methyltransferase